MKRHMTFKDKINNSIFAKGEFYFKLSFTIFFIVLYIIIFLLNDGLMYFESQAYCLDYKGNPFQVHVIDVENGDCMLIKLPNGKTMIIDTGEEKYYDRVSSYLRQYNYYENKNVIDYLVLTHPDSDHIGGAVKLIEDFNVQKIFRPKLYSKYEMNNDLLEFNYSVSTSETYNNAIKKAYNNKCILEFSQKGGIFYAGDCVVEFLSPSLDNYSASNNYSAVIMVTYNSKKFLFTGDAEEEIEKTLIKDYGDKLKADVLKVGHHGSKTSTSQEFLELVNPSYAIISSSGTSNTLPNYEVINRLQEYNVEILATGNINNFALSIIDQEIVFSRAVKTSNHLALILTIFIFLIFAFWYIPFSQLKFKSIQIKKQ